ncbi:MAG: zinc ribbon domain-containing protein [Oscillospiraceae bacterium]
MEKFCQSCGMPLEESVLGTNADGTKSQDYCQYCYANGAFVKEETMEQMIESCIPFMIEEHPQMSAEQAKAGMMEFFPTLKRWAD